MKDDANEMMRSDGKRRISVNPASMSSDDVDVTVCRNGVQSTVITMDVEMLGWLQTAISEYLEAQHHIRQK